MHSTLSILHLCTSTAVHCVPTPSYCCAVQKRWVCILRCGEHDTVTREPLALGPRGAGGRGGWGGQGGPGDPGAPWLPSLSAFAGIPMMTGEIGEQPWTIWRHLWSQSRGRRRRTWHLACQLASIFQPCVHCNCPLPASTKEVWAPALQFNCQ